jgi:hypothetical protein
MAKVDASPSQAYAVLFPFFIFFGKFVRSPMDQVHEGFCSTCATKPQEAGEEPAKLCGHASHLKDTRFCVACAVRLGVCRSCGLTFASTKKEHAS